LDIELTGLVFKSQITAEVVESIVGLDLSSDVDGSADVLKKKFRGKEMGIYSYEGTKVTPKSDDTLAVEFGFNISSFNVGDEFGFSGSDGVFFLVSTDLEVKSSFTIEDLQEKIRTEFGHENAYKRLTFTSVLDSQELFVNVVITQKS